MGWAALDHRHTPLRGQRRALGAPREHRAEAERLARVDARTGVGGYLGGVGGKGGGGKNREGPRS